MIRALAAKELRILFASPLAWTMLAVLQALLAWVFLSQINVYPAQGLPPERMPGLTEFVVTPLFAFTGVVLLAVAPLAGMGLVAGERRHKTLPFLISAPLSMTEIVLGKFLGLWAFLAAVAGLSALMALSLLLVGTLDGGLLAANFLGTLLLAACFAALTLYFSTLTASPLVAGVSSLAAALGLWVLNMAADDPASALHALSLLKRQESFLRGVLDSGDIAYCLLFTALFLALAVRRLDGERFRGE